jgi:hypothetical protein
MDKMREEIICQKRKKLNIIANVQPPSEAMAQEVVACWNLAIDETNLSRTIGHQSNKLMLSGLAISGKNLGLARSPLVGHRKAVTTKRVKILLNLSPTSLGVMKSFNTLILDTWNNIFVSSDMICLISSVQIFGITNMRIGMPRT